MLAEDLDLLVRHPGRPSISLLGPPEPTVLAELRADVERQLEHAEADDPFALLERLDVSLEKSMAFAAPAVGVFVNESVEHVVALHAPVRPRAVVDGTFATRDIVVSLARSRRYLVLTLDGHEANLLAGMADRLRPIGMRHGFPVLAGDDRDDAGERPRRQERSQRRDARIDRHHRAVDAALAAAVPAGDRRPIIVVGDERRIHRFASTSAHGSRIAGLVPGQARAAISELIEELVQPVIDEELRARQRAAVESVGAAIGEARFAAGVPELWPLAHEGRVELLVVEEDHHAPVVVDEQGQAHLVDEAVPGEPADAIDEVIEAVLAAGGRVEPVPFGAIEHWGRIAARLRH